MTRALFALGLLAFAGGTFAQTPAKPAAPDADARPALKMPGDDERPALSNSGTGPATAQRPPGKAAPAPTKRDEAGSTIFGERDEPIGLYITPWRNAYAEQDIDRPARLLQVDLSPVDRVVFSRQVEYYDALTQASLAAKGGAKAPAPAAAPPAAAPTPPPAP